MGKDEPGATAVAASDSEQSVLPSLAEMDTELATDNAVGQNEAESKSAAAPAAGSPPMDTADEAELSPGESPAENIDDGAALLAEVRKLTQPDAPAAPAAAKPGDAPAAPAAPAPGAFDPAGVLKAAEEFGGEELVKNVVKPLTDQIAAMEKRLTEAAEQVKPAAGWAKQAAAVTEARQIGAVHKFFDGQAGKGFAEKYGKTAAEAAASPTMKAAREQVFNDAAALQALASKKGTPLTNERALAMAHELANQGQTKSEAQQKITAELKQRSRGRSAGVSPAPSRGVVSAGAGPDADALATAAAFFE